MPARVGSAREKNNSTRSSTPPSESEGSFVSAQSENTSDKSSKRSFSKHNNQSPSTLRHAASATSDGNSSISSTQEQATPLARKPTLLSPIKSLVYTRVPDSPDSYFVPQERASNAEPWSPGNRKAPASRSSHGIETRTGPPPALSTQRSYNADSAWHPAGPQPSQEDQNGGIESVLKSEKGLFGERSSIFHKRGEISTHHLAPMARERKESGSGGNDEARTLQLLRSKGQKRQNNQEKNTQHRQQEDLFLTLARADSATDDSSDTMSRVERRRVSTRSLLLLLIRFWRL